MASYILNLGLIALVFVTGLTNATKLLKGV
jgi:hypothetical protein